MTRFRFDHPPMIGAPGTYRVELRPPFRKNWRTIATGLTLMGLQPIIRRLEAAGRGEMRYRVTRESIT